MNATRVVPVDDFNGDTPHLIECIKVLIELNDAGALVPHGIGGHARGLLSAAAVRLSAAPPTDAAKGDDSDPTYGPDTKEFWRDRYFERRAVVAKWHARAIELGFDGVNDVLEYVAQHKAAQAQPQAVPGE